MHICFKSDSIFWLPFHSYTQITVGLDSSHKFWVEVHELRWTFPCYTTALNILIIILISARYYQLKFWSRRHHRSGTQHIFQLSYIFQTIKCWPKTFNINLFPALKCSRIAGFKLGHIMSLARVWSFPGGTISRLCLRFLAVLDPAVLRLKHLLTWFFYLQLSASLPRPTQVTILNTI